MNKTTTLKGRGLSFFLSLVIALGLITLPTVTVTAADMSGIYTVGAGGDFTTLQAALDAFNAATITGGVTFRLTENIDYTGGISVSGKALTFDLNGHTLNVNNAGGSGLNVQSGGGVGYTGSGAFNII